MPGRSATRHSIDYLGAGLLAGGLSSVVLFTSLGGTTYAWGSIQTIGFAMLGVVLLALFVLAESRAAEPILPLSLFRNRTFSVTSAIGFIIGLALFGAVTYLPLYMQIVKGRSATASGLLLTPMMAGVLIASIGSGNLISKTGRYKPFPIIGTAVAALGMLLLSRLGVSTPLWLAALYLLVLGLGLGLVMQVLVLAAQNAVPYKMLGVATSGSTLFRQIGGAIGVSIFGAIFANRLATELADRLPAGVHVPAAANPTLVHHLPEAVRQPYIEAFTAAITPIFLAAAGFAIAAFLLTWLLREVPLRETSPAEGIGESFAAPHDDARTASSNGSSARSPADACGRRPTSGSSTSPGSSSPLPGHGCSAASQPATPWSTARRRPRRRRRSPGSPPSSSTWATSPSSPRAVVSS